MQNLLSRFLRAAALAAVAVAALSSPLLAQCTYTINPTSATGAATGGVGLFTVSTQTDCAWTANSNTSWLTVSQVSGGTVNYAYPSNLNLTSRSGSITILDQNSSPVQTFTLNQAGGTCSYTLSVSSASFNAVGGSGSFTVFAAAGCNWAASSSAGWLTASGSGSGDGMVTYSVAQNNSTSGRSATITVGTQTFSVTQSAPCALTLSPASLSFPYTGGNGSFTVSATNSSCDRTAVSNNSDWLTISFGQTGTGNGSVGFTVGQNTSTQPRTGTITVGGNQTFTVTQDGAPSEVCTFTLSPASVNVSALSGLGQITITASAPTCSRTAVTNNDWITITFGQTGTGSGTMGYAYSSNASLSARTGTITIGNATFSINQAGGNCSYSISPSSATAATSGTLGSFTVTATSGCAWNPASSAPDWLSVTSAPGSGSGLVVYSVAPNPTPGSRTATITVGTQTFTVTQAGPCVLTLSSTSQSFPYTGGTGSFTVTASGTSCDRSVLNSNPEWVTINSGSTGSGSGLVTFTAALNPTTVARAATLTVGGFQTFSITEDPAPFETCAFTLSPLTATVSANGGSGIITVTASTPNCSRTATSNADWITIASGQTATGTVPVQWTASANPGLTARTGTISIADQTFTLTQNAGSCAFTLTPQATTFGPDGGTDSFSVNVSSGCSWTPLSSAPDWLTITSGNGPGSGTVTFFAQPNPGQNARFASISVGNQTYPVTEDGTCVLTLSTPGVQIPYTATTGSFSVTASSNTCSRAALSDSTWLTVTSGANGTGSGNINYSATANTLPQSRTGVITVGGTLSFTVSQIAPFCSFSIVPVGANIPQLGGTGSFSVITTCSWTAVAKDPWVVINGTGTGTGNGTVSYTVQTNNTTSSRQTTILLGTTAYTISQSGSSCAFSLTTSNVNVSVSGGSGSIGITTSCSWTATTNVDWITFTSSSSGTGNGAVGYSVAANTTAQSRTGTINIGNQAFTVYQAANACTLALSPINASAPPAASTGTFNVSSPCPWTASSTASWITITSGSSGTSDGAVTYSVAANSTGQSRSGSIKVGTQSFSIIQAGVTCSFSVTPTSANLTSAGGSGTVTVTAAQGCAWTAASNVNWITVSMPGAGNSPSVSGSGVVNYTATPNTTESPRTGTILIAGQPFTVSESAGDAQRTLSAVLNAASYSSGPVSAGEIVTLFGSAIGPPDFANLQLTSDGTALTTSIGGTRVLFDGNPAPMVFASDQQVTAIVPYSVATNPTTKVLVEYQGKSSNTLTVNVAPASPGIFSADFSGGGQGAILNQDYTVNSPSNPAAKGSVIMIYATGEGRTNPAGLDGRLAGNTPPKPVATTTVKIAGIDAPVQYAGGAPGLVAGLLQVNARIATTVPSGNQPIVLTIGTGTSQTALTVSVK